MERDAGKLGEALRRLGLHPKKGMDFDELVALWKSHPNPPSETQVRALMNGGRP